MIRSLRYIPRQVLKGNDILAAFAGYRIHDGGGNDGKQKSYYKICF